MFQTCSFKWPDKSIVYLGITFPHQFKDIVKTNLDPILEENSADTAKCALETCTPAGVLRDPMQQGAARDNS